MYALCLVGLVLLRASGKLLIILKRKVFQPHDLYPAKAAYPAAPHTDPVPHYKDPPAAAYLPIQPGHTKPNVVKGLLL